MRYIRGNVMAGLEQRLASAEHNREGWPKARDPRTHSAVNSWDLETAELVMAVRAFPSARLAHQLDLGARPAGLVKSVSFNTYIATSAGMRLVRKYCKGEAAAHLDALIPQVEADEQEEAWANATPPE